VQLSATIVLAVDIFLTALGRWLSPRIGQKKRAWPDDWELEHLAARCCAFHFRDRRRQYDKYKRVTVHARLKDGACIACGKWARNGRYTIRFMAWVIDGPDSYRQPVAALWNRSRRFQWWGG